jgi:hypothetical protein
MGKWERERGGEGKRRGKSSEKYGYGERGLERDGRREGGRWGGINMERYMGIYTKLVRDNKRGIERKWERERERE